MDFGLSEEQKLIVETTRAFVENELYPHEQEVERTGVLRPELIAELKAKAIEAGLYAANMPADVGGAGRVLPTFCSLAAPSSARNISFPASAAKSPTVSP
jgi:alkylation response protein AidB-like acyl-CoA dehydrogenase